MSDGCDLDPRRKCACDDIAEAVAAERQACVDHLRAKIAAAQAAVRRKVLPEVDGEALIVRLDAAADEIGAGLHASSNTMPREGNLGASE